MKLHPTMRAVLAAACLTAFVAGTADAYRLIQNTGVGRFSAGAAVACNSSGGFTHWNTNNISWFLRTTNQGAGKASAMQAALSSWTAVTPATYNVTYGGTTTAGWTTDGRNTALWATGNGCTGSCLAITALVLQSGQRIVETDISFNNSYTWNTNGSNYDVQAVMTHEVGHSLGIHHTQLTSTPRPTMYASYFGTGGRSLEADDRSALNCIYNRYPPSGAQQVVLDDGEAAAESEGEPATDLMSAGIDHVTLSARPRDGGVLLRFALPAGGDVRLQVFDVAGRVVATVVDGARAAGEHEVAWNGASRLGRAGSGVYFARLVTPSGMARATVVLTD